MLAEVEHSFVGIEPWSTQYGIISFDVNNIKIVLCLVVQDGQICIGPIIYTGPATFCTHLQNKWVQQFKQWDVTHPDEVWGYRISLHAAIKQHKGSGPIDFNETSKSVM